LLFNSLSWPTQIIFITEKVQTGLLIVLGAIFFVAVVFTAFGMKYISKSEDSGKIAESQKAIKIIFWGVGIMSMTLLLTSLTYFLFVLANPNPSFNQACISAPESIGCRACIGQEVALPENFSAKELCDACEAQFRDIANSVNFDPMRISKECGGEGTGTLEKVPAD